MVNIFIPLFSLTGIIFGMLLSLISPEEMSPGKKYFVFLRRILFITTSLFIIYYFIDRIYFLVTFLAAFIVLLTLDLKFKNKYLYIIHYTFFLIPYFLSNGQNFNFVLAVLVFLYGFPTGTLLRINYEKKEKS